MYTSFFSLDPTTLTPVQAWTSYLVASTTLMVILAAMLYVANPFFKSKKLKGSATNIPSVAGMRPLSSSAALGMQGVPDKAMYKSSPQPIPSDSRVFPIGGSSVYDTDAESTMSREYERGYDREYDVPVAVTAHDYDRPHRRHSMHRR